MPFLGWMGTVLGTVLLSGNHLMVLKCWKRLKIDGLLVGPPGFEPGTNGL
jgi:hypothetical protein